MFFAEINELIANPIINILEEDYEVVTSPMYYVVTIR